MGELERLASLIRQRNQAEVEITKIIGRPAAIGHIGEFIASRVFKIVLSASAAEKGYDGRFEDGPIRGATVNIKWYARREGVLDLDLSGLSDYYLVLTVPTGVQPSSRGLSRPWLIKSVYLFNARSLLDELRRQGVKLGIATGGRNHLWEAVEIYPVQRNETLILLDEQRQLLALFG